MTRFNASPSPALRSWRMRFLGWRNRVLSSARFQSHAASNPLLRPIARKRASALFDLVAGFTYTQTLFALVESGMFKRLGEGAAEASELSRTADLPMDATLRLLRAGAAIGIVERGDAEWWILGRHGAALKGNEGALAMIRHHRLLYADLADPLALLADEERHATRLSQFWNYAASELGAGAQGDIAAPYSELMARSQQAVAEEVVRAFPFARAQSLLDLGGGNGTFLRHVAAAHPHLRLGLFDLPDVVDLARQAFSDLATSPTPEFCAGSFFSDSIPQGYELVSLVRILHDHDDEPARRLLANIHRALAPGAQLILAEPMADTPGAEAMGDAYFGWYLWAMGSGRPRNPAEIHTMLRQAGFRSSRRVPTRQPIIASLIVATA